MSSVRIPGILLLEDGTSFEGWCAKEGFEAGELRVCAGGLGAEELVSDPASIGLILCMTDPVIGSCGANAEDLQSRAAFASGMVVRELVDTPASYRSRLSLRRLLSCPVLEGVDVDALAAHLSTTGPQRGIVSTDVGDLDALAAKLADAKQPSSEALLKTVSSNGYVLPPHRRRRRFRVVAYDLGIKTGVLARLAEAGCEVTAVPCDTPAREVLSKHPDGVVLSGGPGYVHDLGGLVDEVAELLGKAPLLGIGLGFDLVAAACGGRLAPGVSASFGTVRPVTDLASGLCAEALSCRSTALAPGSIGEEKDGIFQNAAAGRIRATHRDEAGDVIAGIHLLDKRALAVRFNPEGRPGPHDFAYVFDAFMRLMAGEDDCYAGLVPAMQPALASDKHGSTDSDSWACLSLRVDCDGGLRVAGDPAGVDDPRLVLTDIEFQRMRDAAVAAVREKGCKAAKVDFVANVRDGRLALEQVSCLDDGSG